MKMLVVAALALIFAASAQATPMGIQDDGLFAKNPSLVCESGAQVSAKWTRFIVTPGDRTVPGKIREAHKCGLKVILTVGGTGTELTHPGWKQFMAYIGSLPRADKYVFMNEPDLTAEKPCRYRVKWMKIRHRLGHRLLWGDFSPWHPLTFTQAAANCGKVPKTLDFADHPYQATDPLTRNVQGYELGIGDLGWGRKWLKKNTGIKVRWWLTEFGYPTRSNQYWGDNPFDDIARMWPRAIMQATRQKAAVLMIYQLTPSGADSKWDTHVLDTPAWDVLTHKVPTPPGSVENTYIPLPEGTW